MILSLPLAVTDAVIRGTRLHRAQTHQSTLLVWMSYGA
ncbi:hypothetical protein HNQ36_002333 [Afipia massiliensis]|uniref:Uncharacterized protein n=1 Tax=Afipia massiliensis TaxID=211460 RepID=A0A840MVJ0_9BRAD|nr:hypothetical protein [Afipia massiliensis]